MAQLPSAQPRLRPTALHEDRQGGLWIATAANGLFHFDGREIIQADTSIKVIECIAEDREGNIWVGTGGGGLNRIRQRVVEIQDTQMGVPFESVRSVCEDLGGSIWIVLQNGAVARFRDGVWNTVSTNKDWVDFQATCVTADKSGALWFGTYRQGIFRLQDRQFSALGPHEGVNMANARCLMFDRNGDLWIGYETGGVVQRLHDGHIKNFKLPETARTVRAMVEDAMGKIWMATSDGILLRLDGTISLTRQNSYRHPASRFAVWPPRRTAACGCALQDGAWGA
jgi:ligand-binding sensor domain-containing protein